MGQVEWARELTKDLLAGSLPRRWAHCQGVGRKAESIAEAFGADSEVLVCAAWLHDIGYSPDLAVTGFHPLDGARYLRDKTDVEPRVCSLVAYHSCAAIEAHNRELADVLASEFEPVGGLLADALTFADMTTSPDGSPVMVDDRLAEILNRYGPDDLVARSIGEASPEIRRAVDTVAAFVDVRRRPTNLP
jgi:putative nucleotidyltransferase with HDIG domain